MMTHQYKPVLGSSPGHVRTQGIETLNADNIDDIGAVGMRPIHLALRAGSVTDFKTVITLGADPFAKSGPDFFGQNADLPPENFLRFFEQFSQPSSRNTDSRVQIVETLEKLLREAQDQWTARPVARAAIVTPSIPAPATGS